MSTASDVDAAADAQISRMLDQYEQMERPVAKPDWTFPLPFIPFSDLESDEACWGPSARTLAELRMYALSWAIRSKPGWEAKIKDAQIMANWRAEATVQQEALLNPQKLTENMINFVLQELHSYAQLVDAETGIQAGPFDAIWYSDRLLSSKLLSALRAEALDLEAIPNTLKDWHPRSNGQVLDLVHPSLYPIVYGRTQSLSAAHIKIPTLHDKWRRSPGSISMSKKFCWLPSDFAISSTGEASLVSPYINNLHPQHHAGLYRVIEHVVGSFIPLFERVLSQINGSERDLLRHGQNDPPPGTGRIVRSRIFVTRMIGYDFKLAANEVPCIWLNGDTGFRDDFETEEAMYEAVERLPEAHAAYNGVLERSIVPYSLRGKTIQCIVKLANIHLTPENTEYAGGSWHVEGMLNERIVASGIYYYDEENITESSLAFRVTTTPPAYHAQDDEVCAEILYGMQRDSHCVQDIGSITTPSGRALAWPNIYQHCVAPFRLADSTRPGHRKIMAIFLVDPSLDPIPSATTIPPQQSEWARYALEEAQQDLNSLISKLPVELVHRICAELECAAGGRYMGRAEAEAIRLELMDERTVFVKSRERVLSGSFNMCEH
uniref:Uncharacterized protein n=1 Tax=Mycena chlorophos TaxID=658473 RepID=A0ABQ0LFK9_MYCCL|nr:predicted protein [Mycena chlorophos]